MKVSIEFTSGNVVTVSDCAPGLFEYQESPSGLVGVAPSFSGLYQLNVTVPPNAPAGVDQVVLSINGQVAKTSNLPVQ